MRNHRSFKDLQRMKPNRSVLWLWVCLLVWGAFTVACSGPKDPVKANEQKTQANTNSNSQSAGKATTLSVASSTYPLPEDLAKQQASFRLGSIAKLGTLVGGATGLYHLSNGKLSSLEQEPVVAIAPWRGKFLVIAQTKQLVVWDGELHQPLKFGSAILDVAAQSDHILWIATTKQLWRLQNDKLEAFASIKDVRKLYSFTGSSYVVAQDKEGVFFFFRTDSTGKLLWSRLEKTAPSVEQLVPGFNGMLWGLSKGKLVVRETKDGKVRWGEYDWTQWGDDKLAEKVGALQWLISDVHNGRLWAVGKTSIVSIYGKKVSYGERPAALSRIKSLVATSDSTLWVNDGKQLHQLTRTQAASITYEGQIAPFMKKNCWRCHQKVGPGRPLDDYELVKKFIGSILKQIESGGMPTDGKPLVGGDANLLKRWMENKMPK